MFLGGTCQQRSSPACLQAKDSGEEVSVSARGQKPFTAAVLQLPGRRVNKVMGEKKLLLDLLSQTTDGIYLRADFKMRF